MTGRPTRLPVPGPLVLWLAAEAAPFASAGGLGDVVGSLPAYLRARGFDVRVLVPRYSQLDRTALSPPLLSLELPRPGGLTVTIHEALESPSGVPTYMVACDPLFGRAGLYGEGGIGYHDAPFRYGIFQLAARAFAARLEPAPVILHCHDWCSALLPALLRLPGQRPERLAQTRTVYTVHNLQFQGDSDRDLLDALALPWQLWNQDFAEHYGRLIPMKAGLLHADRVTTVSPTYARETRTPEGGFGLDGPLRALSEEGRYLGILNGIDVNTWNPATDEALPAHFAPGDIGGRARVKAALRKELGLAGGPDEPLLGYVGRVTYEKGVDLIDQAMPALVGMGAKLVVLGTGDRTIEAALSRREWEYPDHFRAVLRFDPLLSRRVFAGIDLLLVPSRTEPCGLVQLYGLRYGAVPAAHGVGGIKDTVEDGFTGFVFHEPSVGGLIHAVQRAMALWPERQAWAALRDRGMRADFSWDKSADAYAALYRDVMTSPARGPV